MLLHKYTTDCGRRLGDIHTHTIIFVALCPFLGSEAGRSLRTLNLVDGSTRSSWERLTPATRTPRSCFGSCNKKPKLEYCQIRPSAIIMGPLSRYRAGPGIIDNSYRFRDRDQINWGEKGHFSGGALGKRPDLINGATHGIICKRRCHNGYHSCSFKSFIGFTRSQIDDFSPGAKTPAISVMRDIKAGMGTRRDQRKYEGSDVMCLFYELIKLDGRFLRWSKINNRGSRDH
jgi:hypothetical protein